MKKITIFIMLTIAIISSCSNEDNSIPSEPVMAYISTNDSPLRQISKSIDSINTEKFDILPLSYYNESTRGLWGNILRGIKAVAAADAKGAADGLKNSGWPGAVTGAICSSFSKVVDLLFKDDLQTAETRSNTSPLKITPYSVRDSIFQNMTRTDVSENVIGIGKETDYQTKEDSAGFYHNKVILSLLKKHNNVNYWTDITPINLTIEIAKSIEEEFHLNKGQLSDNKELITNITDNSIILSSNENNIIESYYSNLQKNNPRMFDLINVIETYINGLGEIENTDDCIEYSKVIMDIIDKSDVDEEDKLSLRISINVAFSSYRLWNPDVFNK